MRSNPPLKIPFLNSFTFQNANSPLIEQLIFFHNHTMTVLVLIISIVGYNIIKTIRNNKINLIILESQSLELFWTVAPTFILLVIGFPSIRLLYLIDEVQSPIITLKTIGHQWYWRYEYSDISEKELDSYIVPQLELNERQTRLIEVDNRIVLPYKTQVRNLISSADVLHSWTVPSLGVKVDAVPGRLNQIRFIINRPGVYYGQCSEICGANHSFMPISVEGVNYKAFIKWALTL